MSKILTGILGPFQKPSLPEFDVSGNQVTSFLVSPPADPVFSPEPPLNHHLSPFSFWLLSLEARPFHFLSPLCPGRLGCHQAFPTVVTLIHPFLFHFWSHHLKSNLDHCDVLLAAFSVLSFPKVICGYNFLMSLSCSRRSLAFTLTHTCFKSQLFYSAAVLWGTWLNCLEPQFPHLENRSAVRSKELTNVRCLA